MALFQLIIKDVVRFVDAYNYPGQFVTEYVWDAGMPQISLFLPLSRFCDLIDLTGPKHLKEVTHVDEFDIPGLSCEPVG